MESRAIANALESRYPSPSLHLESPVLSEVEDALSKAMSPLIPVLLPGVPALLNLSSEVFFQRTRKEKFGMPLAELKKERGGEKAWQQAEAGLKGLAEVLKKEGGPFCLGKQG